LLIALMMGANHVAARTAFNHGVDVVTAVTFRSTVTAFVVALIVWQQKVSLQLTVRHRKSLLLIGALIAVQSVCLYSAVARLPVALALLAFNTYPLLTAFWARVLYGHRPERVVLLAMPVMLVGLALALDVSVLPRVLGPLSIGGRSERVWLLPWLRLPHSVWRSSSPSTRLPMWTDACVPSPPWPRWPSWRLWWR
jgi:drug/metabolite transporter (DMT)-like permease